MFAFLKSFRDCVKHEHVWLSFNLKKEERFRLTYYTQYPQLWLSQLNDGSFKWEVLINQWTMAANEPKTFQTN